ncbi:hypothetical protein [Rhodobacter ferrooxidans]|uniref:Nitric oxide reductase F protein, putative n=1 Tax=Rhodobacter ferrooxidans TaxID=371731 RepID=C8RWH6_9RHOB|nr:hypothetical protein [Rhodobacter sp. SW2]EEW26919.1 nitric oxide reductase F protein, putative [Rhodobacter sp. SW2]
MTRETRTWTLLVGLSALSTLLALLLPDLTGIGLWLAGAALLALAFAKARLILADYLGLAAARPWLAGFTGVLALLMSLWLVLLLVA